MRLRKEVDRRALLMRRLTLGAGALILAWCVVSVLFLHFDGVLSKSTLVLYAGIAFMSQLAKKVRGEKVSVTICITSSSLVLVGVGLLALFHQLEQLRYMWFGLAVLGSLYALR